MLAVSMDGVVRAAQMAAYARAEYPVLSDQSGTVVRDYGVYNLLGDMLAAPATFLIRKDMTIAWQHVGENVSDRPTPADILTPYSAVAAMTHIPIEVGHHDQQKNYRQVASSPAPVRTCARSNSGPAASRSPRPSRPLDVEPGSRGDSSRAGRLRRPYNLRLTPRTTAAVPITAKAQTTHPRLSPHG